MKARRAAVATCALLIGGAAALTYSSYRDDVEAARERVGSGGRIVETPCGPIEYAVAGDGPPVLAVHGAGGGYDQGMLFGAALAESGFRVIAMSRFGYLGTPLPSDASAAAQADAHACLLDALDIPRATVLGGSAGAPSSVQLALRHPERVSALVMTFSARSTPRATRPSTSRARASWDMRAADMSGWAVIRS